MYILKHLPEDFRVTEIPLFPPQEKGKYLYFQLWKKNYGTMKAVQRIARELGVQEKRIGFAGSKDKQAVTKQACSVFGVSKERLEKINIAGMHITFLGYGGTPISLGDLQGNSFEIVIRNLDVSEYPTKAHFIPNYFDEQRFGKENIVLGKYFLKKNFPEIIKILKNETCEEYLLQHQNDYVGALKLLPIRLLRLYLNAYQSYLWNETLARYLRSSRFLYSAEIVLKEVPYSLGFFVFPNQENFHNFFFLHEIKIPLIGFDYKRIGGNEVLHNIISELMKSEGISPEDFILKQIPQLTLEGDMRKAFVEVKELQVGSVEDDEFHSGKKKVKVSFALPKGSYATMAVRGMMSCRELVKENKKA